MMYIIIVYSLIIDVQFPLIVRVILMVIVKINAMYSIQYKC